MTTRILFVVMLLFILCPIGCFSLDKQRNRRQMDAYRKDMNDFKNEFDYYVFNIDRPYDKPHRTDRSILRQMLRDLRSARNDWDYFVGDLPREELPADRP